MTRPRPTDLEIQVLSLLWDRAPRTVREVLDSMPDRKKRAYTTILSILQVMEKKGLVSHETSGRTHLFHPAVKRSCVLSPLVKDLLRNAFSGSAPAAVEYLLGQTDARDSDFDEIARLIENARRSKKEKGK